MEFYYYGATFGALYYFTDPIIKLPDDLKVRGPVVNRQSIPDDIVIPLRRVIPKPPVDDGDDAGIRFISDQAADTIAALSGYDAVLQEAGRLTQPQKELDEGVQAELNGQLRVLAGLLDQHPEVTVTWFQPDGKKEGGDYLVATGAVRKIDAYREVVILEGGEQIPFRDLLSLSGECLPDNK